MTSNLIELLRQKSILAERQDADRWTFSCASYAPPEFHCVVRRATLLSRVEELIGQTDVKVGAPLFDRRFLIFSDEPSLVSLWFPDRIQQVMLALSPAELRLSGEVLHLDWRGLLSKSAHQSNLFALFEALQDVPAELYRAWEVMAQVCGGAVISPKRRWDQWRISIKGTLANIPLRLYPSRQRSGEWWLCLEWQRHSDERYTIQRSTTRPGDELVGLTESQRDELLRPELRERLLSLPMSRLEISQQEILWSAPALVLSEETLRAMLSLLTEFWPVPTLGPYR